MSILRKLARAIHCIRCRFRKWLFGAPTTILEVVNIAYLFGWAVAILDDDLAAMPFYAGFLGARAVQVNDKAALLFSVAALLNIMGLIRRSCNLNRGAMALQGFSLQLSAVLWLTVSLNFLASYPPLHVAVLIYGVHALACWISGRNMHRHFEFAKQVRCYGE